MTQDKFTVTGDQLTGRGLTFDISLLRSPKEPKEPKERKERDGRLVEIGESSYLQGRESVMFSYDDRFDLHFAVDALRALAVIVGPGLSAERHGRAAAALARLLQEQASSS